jgi:hypothetical protein
MDATSTIWHVRVFEPHKVEHYYFRNREDIMTSIHTTWRKKMDSITINERPQHIMVINHALLERTELLAEMMTLGQLIHEGPTHF